MNYESKTWAEAKGACLRNFNEQGDIDSVNGALALRPKIEKIVVRSGRKALTTSISSVSGGHLRFRDAG